MKMTEVKIATPTAIEIDRLSKRYQTKDGPVLALDNVSFGIAKSEFIAVLGPSGCGKTTLLKVLRDSRRLAGEVRMHGKPVRGPNRQTGIVFQSPALMQWRSALNNVLLPTEILGLPADRRSKDAPSYSISSDSRTLRRSFLTSYRVECSNASRLLERWFIGRTSCSSTSRSARSTR